MPDRRTNSPVRQTRLPAGANLLVVTVLAYDDQSPFRVTPEEKRLLLESIAQADRGEFVDAEELLAELDESN